VRGGRGEARKFGKVEGLREWREKCIGFIDVSKRGEGIKTCVTWAPARRLGGRGGGGAKLANQSVGEERSALSPRKGAEKKKTQRGGKGIFYRKEEE